MAHRAQIDWCKKIKKDYPQHFVGKKVLDIGSLDINGNNKFLFNDCEYVGLDVVKGKNVNAVSIAHEYRPKATFDVVLSTNALEHDMYFKLTLKKMVEVLKPSGLMFISVPSERPEHGTKRIEPFCSGTSELKGEWANYYRNLVISDITDNLDLTIIFKEFSIGLADCTEPNRSGEMVDLRFVGVKR